MNITTINITTEHNLARLLTALKLTQEDLTTAELKSLTWLADAADWRCLNNLIRIIHKAKKEGQG